MPPRKRLVKGGSISYEQFNNRQLPYIRFLAATELLYFMYICSVARNRMS